MKLLIAVMITACILVFTLTACDLQVKIPEGSDTVTSAPAVSSAAPEISASPQVSAEPTSALAPTAPPTAPPAPAPTVHMYSSYADMVSFDPSTGAAEFDYWNMLKGDDAVQWLVDNKGYSPADAQAEVDNYADSEFVKSNNNPQLRSIDLSEVPVRMMFHPDGTMLAGAEPIAASFSDLCSLYADHPEVVLDSFFYYVTVDSGGSIEVDQVFWP